MARIVMNILKKILSAIIAALIIVSSGHAGETGREYLVKAAFLYNFIKFVSWEKTGDKNNIKICAFGNPEYLMDLKSIEDKKAHEKSIIVSEAESIVKEPDCNVIFISRYEPPDYGKLISEAQEHGILTVSDIEGFAEKGGIIELFTSEDNRVRFKINIRAAEKNGLKISSELLKLAVIVGRGN